MEIDRQIEADEREVEVATAISQGENGDYGARPPRRWAGVSQKAINPDRCQLIHGA